ncbi:hypothetical protein KAI78_08710 [bacterium]|nr:hypothetical protein [bacterium]
MEKKPFNWVKLIVAVLLLMCSIAMPVYSIIFVGFTVMILVNWGIGAVVGFFLIFFLYKIPSKKVQTIMWFTLFALWIILSAIFKMDVFVSNSGFLFGIVISGLVCKQKAQDKMKNEE